MKEERQNKHKQQTVPETGGYLKCRGVEGINSQTNTMESEKLKERNGVLMRDGAGGGLIVLTVGVSGFVVNKKACSMQLLTATLLSCRMGEESKFYQAKENLNRWELVGSTSKEKQSGKCHWIICLMRWG